VVLPAAGPPSVPAAVQAGLGAGATTAPNDRGVLTGTCRTADPSAIDRALTAARSASHGWDALGATWFGYRTLWVNRYGLPFEELGTPPTYSGSSLRDVLALPGLAPLPGASA